MAEMNPETQGYANAETGNDRASWVGNWLKRKKENERERTLHPKELWENEDLLRQRDYERQKDLMIQKGLVDTTGYKDKGVIDVQTQAAADNVGLDTTNRFLELGGFEKKNLPPSQLPGNDQPNQPGAVATPEDAAAMSKGASPMDILRDRAALAELSMRSPRGTNINFKRDTSLAEYGDQPGTPPTTPGGGGGGTEDGPAGQFDEAKIKKIFGRSGTGGKVQVRDSKMTAGQRKKAEDEFAPYKEARQAEAKEAGVEWNDDLEGEIKQDFLSSMFPLEQKQVSALNNDQIKKNMDWVHPADIPSKIYPYPDPNEKAEVGTVAADGGISVGSKGSRKQPKGETGNVPGQQFDQGSSGQ